MSDELKEAFDYQADAHVFMFQRQPMIRSMDLSNQVAMPEEPQDQSAPMDMSMPSEADAPEPSKPLYTEDQLALMPEWISGSKKMFSVMNDGQRFIGSDKQAAAYGLDLMSEFNWNMTGPAGIPGESGISAPGFAFQVAALMSEEAGEENALTFLQMLNTYSDTATNGATIKRAFRGIFADPLTYAGIVGKLGSMGIRASAGFTKGPIKDMLMKTATGIAMPYDLGVKYPGRAGMAAGAGYGMGFEGGTMGVEQAAGYEPTVGEAATRLGTAGAVGAGAGGVLGKALGAGVPAAGQALRQGADVAGQAAEARMAERGPITDRVMSGVDPMEVIDPALAAAGKLARGGQTKAHPNRISTRLPTAVKATENPVDEPLQIGLEESKANPEQFEHNVRIVQNYPNMTEAQAKLPPEEASEEFINHVKDNLLWIHDKIPAETRERSKLWYDGARAITDRWSKKYGLPDASIAGVLAALSPQMDWYKNVSLAERVITTMAKKDHRADDAMIAFAKKVDPKTKKPKLAATHQPIVDNLLGKTLDELTDPLDKAIFVRLYDEVYNPRTHNVISPEGDIMETVKKADGSEAGTGWGSFVEITKAVEAVESGGDKAKLTPLMGTQHKVRSFYNNILDPNGPNGDVTIDTHAVAAGLLKPLSGQSTEVHHNFGSAPDLKKRKPDWKGATKNSSVSGVQGNYGLYAEAYRRAAAERGILPREMQSITWEAARGLFTDVYKRNPKNIAQIDDYWQKYRKGELTIDEVRDGIEQSAGGINPPTWKE